MYTYMLEDILCILMLGDEKNVEAVEYIEKKNITPQ